MPKNIYLTNEGLNKIKKEKELLEKKKAHKLKFEFPIFNRSKRTDPDYVNCLEEVGFMKKRIMEIKNILRNAKLIAVPKAKPDKIDIGAKITVEDEEGQSLCVQIVEAIETDPFKGKISKQCPLGCALLGKKNGETVQITKPVPKKYAIKKIEY